MKSGGDHHDLHVSLHTQTHLKSPSSGCLITMITVIIIVMKMIFTPTWIHHRQVGWWRWSRWWSFSYHNDLVNFLDYNCQDDDDFHIRTHQKSPWSWGQWSWLVVGDCHTRHNSSLHHRVTITIACQCWNHLLSGVTVSGVCEEFTRKIQVCLMILYCSTGQSTFRRPKMTPLIQGWFTQMDPFPFSFLFPLNVSISPTMQWLNTTFPGVSGALATTAI